MRGEGRTKYAFREGYAKTTVTFEGLTLRSKLRLIWAVIRGQDLVIVDRDSRAKG